VGLSGDGAETAPHCLFLVKIDSGRLTSSWLISSSIKLWGFRITSGKGEWQLLIYYTNRSALFNVVHRQK
jgi:hypothetical protein